MRRAAVALLALGCAACSAGGSPAPSTSTPSSTPASTPASTLTSTPTVASTPATDTAAPQTSSTPQPVPPFIAAVRWVPGRHGEDLIVTPSDAGRSVTTNTAEATAWREVTRLAPRAGTLSMQRQFECHWRYARSKGTWNLEPWRAVVPMDEVVAAYCNPGGPE